jgi:hypothetical protein
LLRNPNRRLGLEDEVWGGQGPNLAAEPYDDDDDDDDPLCHLRNVNG